MANTLRVMIGRAVLGCTAALGLAATAARADTVWMVTQGAPFERPKVKIEGMQGDALIFRGQNARAADPKPLSEIHHIQADDEPALNAGETAFVAGKWDE